MAPYSKLTTEEQKEGGKFSQFLAINSYVRGTYDQEADFVKLNDHVNAITENDQDKRVYFYLALPPSVYQSVSAMISNNCREGIERILRQNVLRDRLG